MENIFKKWTLSSWKKKKALQQPEYIDEKKYMDILDQIRSYPPLISSGEVDNLKVKIGEAGDGKRIILQGGDCVERFLDCNEKTILNKIKIILQMSVVLTFAAKKPVLRIGRIAGQFFKPRSSNTELVGGKEIPTYRGDSINCYEQNEHSRLHKPSRLLMSYFHAASTINYIRAMISGGFADLHKPYTWNLHAIEKTEKWEEYKGIIEHILDAIRFMESFGGVNTENLGSIEFFTSHEGLHLGFEEAMTRKNPNSGKYYNLGAHMLWIGERTRNTDGAHVEYFRGISNPIGIKIGCKISTDELIELLSILNPEGEKGRITLITRLGSENVAEILPELINAVNKKKMVVTWSCDPMHGNTSVTSKGIKTRNFNKILSEFKETYIIHKANGSNLAGVHFELTGEDVTECIGGAVGVQDEDLLLNYQSYCDPRLNYTQSMEMAFLIAGLIKNK